MITLCMIVKATDDEAKLLDRCLKYVAQYVDEICLTITGENEACEKVAKKYKAKVSHFTWVKDFAKARNFNFSQATNEFILWLDCDDILKGAERLESTVLAMKKNGTDAGVMNYLYDFDDNGECTVKHLKTRIVKKDSVQWVGAVHEDFDQLREISAVMIKGIEVMHLTDNERAEVASERNLEIAQKLLKEEPNDPRNLWLVANAERGIGNIPEAVEAYKLFVKKSMSEEEKYLAYLNLADLTNETDYAYKALEIRPNYPNAYFKLGELLVENKRTSARDFIEIGLQLPKPEDTIIVHNPRDYDYNPLMLLMRIHFELGQYKKALEILDKMITWYPKDAELKRKKKLMETELGEALKIDEYIKKADKEKDLAKYVESLPEKIQSHPKMCQFRNQNIIKKTSSGKDLVFYCSYTQKEWTPETAEKSGVGGSEESVINIALGLSKLGWNVTVYNSCGKGRGEYDGVKYRQHWEYNVRDKQDVTIIWRHPKPVDFKPNSTKLFIDLHDVIPEGEFTPERVEHIDKIFVKTNAHRILFPKVADEKFAIIPNGLDPKHFDIEVKRDPYLILNTSSPDRHLEATLNIFEALIEKHPDKPWKLAWYYGWGIFDQVHEKNDEVMLWKNTQMARFDKLKKAGRAEGGTMISHKEIAKMYMKAGVFLYPTRFYEIHCISAAKAQAGGALPITSDYAALDETVQYGYKIHEDMKKMGDNIPELQGLSIDDYVEKIANHEDIDKEAMQKWSKETYDWSNIVKQWNDKIQNI